MLEKIKNFLKSDYAAPLTEPARRVWENTTDPLKEFAECVKEGFSGNEYSYRKSGVRKFLNELVSADSFIVNVCGMFGSVVGGLIGGISAVSLMAHGVVSITGGILAGIATTSLGVVAGPFVAIGIATACCLVASCITGVIPGVIEGTAKAIQYHKKIKPVTAPKLPQQQIASTVSPVENLIGDLERLPSQERQKALDRILKKFGGASQEVQAAPKDSTVSTSLQRDVTVRKPLTVSRKPL